MSFDTHVFYRPKCDYLGCETRWGGVEYDWNYDESGAIEEVTESDDWICLYDDDERHDSFARSIRSAAGSRMMTRNASQTIRNYTTTIPTFPPHNPCPHPNARIRYSPS